jgi:hypothetical protein
MAAPFSEKSRRPFFSVVVGRDDRSWHFSDISRQCSNVRCWVPKPDVAARRF